jgi:hypothetical protein
MYYLHDREADTSERVLFTHTENVPTRDPEKALKWMAWTAIHAEEIKREAGAPITGQKCQKPVFTMSLSWHPEQTPANDHMISAGKSALAKLGLEEHETLFVGHSDGVPHVHLIVNTIHPETGQVNTLSFSKLKLSKWAEEYEREHGKIYCEERVENNERREEEYVKYREPELEFRAQITELYHASDSGAAFQEALAQAGYKLAQGKRIVVIDAAGKIHSLSRQIEGVKAKDIRAKLADLPLPLLADARGEAGAELKPDEAKRKPKADQSEEGPAPRAKDEQPKKAVEAKTDDKQPQRPSEPEYLDRDAQDRAWQESIMDAALTHEPVENPAGPPPTKRRQPRTLSPGELNAIQDRQLAELGQFYDENMRAKQQLAGTLEKQHGEHERKLRAEAEHLDQVLRNSSRIRTLWLKVTGQISKTAEEDLRTMRKTLANIEWRQSEARGGLEADIARRREEIQARHERERHAAQYEQTTAPARESERPFEEVSEDPDLDEDLGPSLEY